MNAKEKAEKLIDLFKHYVDCKVWDDRLGYDELFFSHEQEKINAKKCALICVNEILNVNPQSEQEYSTLSFWEEVKSEIELL